MALPSPAEQLRAAASCPVCLELFRDPVSLRCGHNFCRGCVERCGPGPGATAGPLCCPQCRDAAPGGGSGGLRPSRELGHIAGIARELLPALLPAPPPPAGTPGTPGDGSVCGRHREPLRLFCREERALLCAECARERRERHHRVVPIEEAAREYREQIQSCLQALKEEREKFLESRKSGAWRSLHLDRMRDEGQRLAREFRELRRSLEEQQRLLLAQLGELEAAMARGWEQAAGKVSEELSQLDTLIWEMEGKFQQPPSRFLQDIQQLLHSCETMRFQPPAEISPELERSLEDFAQRNVLVRGTLRRCQDSLMFLLQEPASLTLDPDTAHPHLHLSADAREARGQLRPRDAPDHPERFDFEPCVLARGGFTSGRHFWEVEVGQGGVWALGVMRESSRRRGPLSLTPKEGVWALEAFHSLTSPRARLRLRPPPRRLRVALDYEGRRVAFFSAGDDVPILEYTRAAFRGERLRPWFKMGLGARLLEVTRGERCQDRAVAGRVVCPLDWVGFGFSMRICLQDLKNELEKRQAKKTPEISHQETPEQGQEEKNQQQDVKSSISRCGKVTFQLPLDAAPGLEERVCHFSWRSSALKETLRKLQASVTLDPDTAHPELVLSEDGKSVWRGSSPRLLLDRPERFDHWPFVLGRQGFASGRHCWHVDVGDGGDWAVGVARDSVPRKGRLSLGPQGGIWALEKWGAQLRALTARKATPVAPRWLPRRVSVHLDCHGGSVAFLDAEDGALLFVFSRAAFGGERLRPWLWVVGARSRLRVWP
ncbi:E3 ubiquitin-protein ligase TRIM11-like [Melozone crissalis]|uniref:E3 ubiquitin-protein ligase TRIM11-like n=1 Tax=Melozone crissalis TaxID=40204 RepID=UPI0023DCA5AB|nr:E3 ubiquitin-protein ligase TRIM11-like [Melozone crissalis]